MVEQADVFLTNLRLPAIKRLGLGYTELSARNPRIVYGLGSGYGVAGPDAENGAVDLVAQARSGMMYTNGTPAGEPLQVGTSIADQLGGLLLAWGVLLALYAVQRTGEGQFVSSSILAGQIFAQGSRSPIIFSAANCGRDPHWRGLREAKHSPSGTATARPMQSGS